MVFHSLGVVMVEIPEWRALKTLVRKFVDVTSDGMDVPLSALARVGPWLVQEKVRSGAVSFRMREVFRRAIERFFEDGVSGDIGTDSEEARGLLRGVVGELKRCYTSRGYSRAIPIKN